MRISDWSSDVCSSDLRTTDQTPEKASSRDRPTAGRRRGAAREMAEVLVPVELRPAFLSIAVRTAAPEAAGRSVQGRVKRGRSALDAYPEEPRGILCQRRPHARGIHARPPGRTTNNTLCHHRYAASRRPHNTPPPT